MSLCSVSNFIYCYAECHYAECHYAQWDSAECDYAEYVMLGLIILNVMAPLVYTLFLYNFLHSSLKSVLVLLSQQFCWKIELHI